VVVDKRLPVSEKLLKFDVGKFKVKKLNNVEVKELYLVKISN
jgi:hypothetical protein